MIIDKRHLAQILKQIEGDAILMALPKKDFDSAPPGVTPINPAFYITGVGTSNVGTENNKRPCVMLILEPVLEVMRDELEKAKE